LNTAPLEKAQAYFRKTLEVDSAFSKAYSGLAYCFLFSEITYDLSSSNKTIDSLLYFIQKSLIYDRNNMLQ
jgi:hypothetical protein